jgi:transcriptional regulator with XRE-family HTH domain
MNLLRAVRLGAGLSQSKLAKKSGVALRTIRAIELGKTRARMDTRRRLVAALEKPLSEHGLLFGPMHYEKLDTPCRLRRLELGINQEEVAMAAGVSPASVVSAERRKVRPTMDVRRRLCKALEVPFEEHRLYFGPMRGEKAS